MSYGITYSYNMKDKTVEYNIIDTSKKGRSSLGYAIVWTKIYPISSDIEDEFPLELRQKYEELCERPEFLDELQPEELNIVELIADEDCAWDQPCKFGHRVEQHAVYCHASHWLYAPRKCRRNRTNYKHEDCRGFKSNPNQEETI
jgi:hypothetical protein